MAATAKLEARISSELHALIKHAAELQGRTVTDFIVTATQEAAKGAVEEISLLRLAIEDQQHTGKGLGGSLLVDAILNATRSTTGIWAMHVDAKDQQARAFCLKYGFISFKHRTDSLYLPLTNTLLKDLESFSIV